MSTGITTDAWIGLAVALGCGLLVGVERERRKGAGPARAAAGVRTFAVVGLAGALAATSQATGAVPALLVVVGALAALAYWRGDRRDPGLTTEVALIATSLVGVLAVSQPALAAACATALALLLALRARLHRAATRLLGTEELHDALLLAALVLIVLPLVPAQPVAWLGGLKLRPFALLFVLILGLQAASHGVLRVLGARAGWPLVGLLAGFVSSSAAVLTLGRQVKQAGPRPAALLLASAAASSGVATWIQVPLVVAALVPGHAAALLPLAAAGALATAAVALLWWWRAGAPDAEAAERAPKAPPLPASRRVLRLREALGLAALLGGVALLVTAAQTVFGDAGRIAATLLGALADVHAAVAALAALVATGAITPEALGRGVLMAVAVNVASRSLLAGVAGGGGYALRVGTALAAGLVAALVAATLAGGAGLPR